MQREGRRGRSALFNYALLLLLLLLLLLFFFYIIIIIYYYYYYYYYYSFLSLVGVPEGVKKIR